MAMTLKELQTLHTKQVDANRALGVVEYDSKEPKADEVWEVTSGLKYLPDGPDRQVVLGPGSRFRPTQRQVERTKSGRGGLTNKARPLSHTEYTGVRASRTQVAGADFREMGLKALPMTQHAFALADAEKLSAEDFEGMEPASENGYTKSQVEEIIARRGN